MADNGPQFVTGEMKDFLKANGVRLCLSSTYHPASNCVAERAVRTFKEAMKVIKNEPGTQMEILARFYSAIEPPLIAPLVVHLQKDDGEMTANKARISETRFDCTD